MFVSHFHSQNQIPLPYASSSLLLVFTIILLLAILSIRRKEPQATSRYVNNDQHFTVGTTETLRGIAILFLIFGHLAYKCIEGVSPFEYAGKWAVIIFLLVSGIGLTKTYGLKKSTKGFFKKRIMKLMFPVWTALILFYLLDLMLLNRTYTPLKIIFSFFGIMDHNSPNGPMWFVSYIIYLYIIFYIVLLINTNYFCKFFIILFFSYFATFCITYSAHLNDIFHMWRSYTIVFPIAIFIGFHNEKICYSLKSLYHFSSFIYACCLLACFLIYELTPNLCMLSQTTPLPLIVFQFAETFRPIFFVGCITMFAYLLDVIRLQTNFLLFLGKYAFEIYLIHFPFMVYYDFFLFRKPLILYFFVYAMFIILLSYQLRIASTLLNRLLFRISEK